MPPLTLEDIQDRIASADPGMAIAGTLEAPDMRRAREQSARHSIEHARGAAYTDAEWSEAKQNLIEFFGILAEWKRAEAQRR